MDFWILLIILALAVPVCAISGLVIAVQARGRIRFLENRIVALEQELRRRASAPPAPAASPAASPAGAQVPRTSAPAPQPERPAEAARPDPVTQAPPPRPSGAATRPPAAGPKPEKPGRSLEELIGARWSVIVGGLALALGGIFLVRYSIEQGWLGPAARVTFGALFSAGLLVLGERMRRAEARAGRPRRPIDIPAVVTSAGATTAFAVTYAAYALYGFLGPAAAFVLLGIVAVATLFAAVLHGPILGALGLIGAYAAPLLVSSDEPNLWALLSYLLFPTGAAFAVARIRDWPALAGAAGVAAFLWGALALGALTADSGTILLYAAALTGLAALMHSGASATAPAPSPRPDYVSSGLIGLFGLLAAASPAIGGFSPAALASAGALFAGHLALGFWGAGLAPVAAAAGVFAALTMLGYDDSALAAVAELTKLPDPGEAPRTAGVASFLTFSAAIGAIFLTGGAMAARLRPDSPYWWTGLLASSAAATPLLLLAVAYWRISAFEPDLRFATIAVLLAGALAALCEDGARRESSGAASPAATAAYAVGASAALGLALAMAMREGALTVALAFLAMALGYVAAKRPIRALGWLAIAASALVLARVVIEPRIVGDISQTPIFNALLWGYGAPAAAFWLGARQFAKVSSRTAGFALPATVLEGLALLFALLFGFTQSRHLANGGVMDTTDVKLLEVGLDATIAFALAAITARLGLGRASPALKWGSIVASGLGVAISLLGLMIAANPAFTGEPVRGVLVVNDLTPGYLLPAIAAFAAARFAAEGRPDWFRRGLGGAALILAFAYVTLTVRFAFNAPVLDGPFASDAELYAYSAVWLVFGLALLAAGVIRRSLMLRVASGFVIVVVIAKVFLFDLAGVGGVWRALSFIGLGGVLVGVGMVYQRLLSPKPAAA